MWLMEERQKLVDLTMAVRLLGRQLEELQLNYTHIQQELARRKDQQIVLEARLDRVEHGRKIATKVPVTSPERILSAGSLAPSSSSPSSAAPSLPLSLSSPSVSSASLSGDKEPP